MTIEQQLIQHGITPNPLADQFFLLNQDVTRQMIDWAEISKDDVVLEIGAGNGVLTRPLADRAKHVVHGLACEAPRVHLADVEAGR